MSFKAPGATTYQTISSSFEFGPNDNAYQQFANVTPIVRAAGSG